MSLDIEPKSDQFEMTIEIPGYQKRTVNSDHNYIMLEADQS
jgi:hypothetical protein